MVSILQLPGGDEADWFIIATAGVELSFIHVIQVSASGVQKQETQLYVHEP